MPGWSPLDVGLLAGLLAAVLWTVRTARKNHQVAGFYMMIESKFWRSLFVNFLVAFLLGTVLATLAAALVWLLVGLAAALL